MSEIWGKMWGIVVWKPECAGRLDWAGAVWRLDNPHVAKAIDVAAHSMEDEHHQDEKYDNMLN